MEHMHMPQVSDSGELNKHSHIALIHVAFPIVGQGRHSRTVISELNTARIEDPDSSGYTPLLTLRHAITGRQRIAQGQSGSLLLTPRRTCLQLQSSEDSPPTPCRF